MKRMSSKALCAVSLLLFARSAAASVAVHVEYLDVPPEAASEFAAAVTGPVRELNEARLERGEISAWYHYSARFPWAMRVTTPMSSSPSFPASPVSRVRRSPTATPLGSTTQRFFEAVPGVPSEDYYGKVEYKHVTVDSLTAGAEGADAFLEKMRTVVMPGLQKRTDAGEVVNWGLFARRLPVSNEQGYEYALVSRFKGFGNLETPQITAAEADHLHESVAWRLVDIIE